MLVSETFRNPIVALGRFWSGFLGLCLVLSGSAVAGDDLSQMTPAQRGYHWLTTKAYLPPDFDDEVFESLWKVWPADLQKRAKDATAAERL